MGQHQTKEKIVRTKPLAYCCQDFINLYLDSNTSLSRDHLFVLWRHYGGQTDYQILDQEIAAKFLKDFFSAWGLSTDSASELIPDIQRSVFRYQEVIGSVSGSFNGFTKLFKLALEALLSHPERSATLRRWQREVSLSQSLQARFETFNDQSLPLPPLVPWLVAQASEMTKTTDLMSTLHAQQFYDTCGLLSTLPMDLISFRILPLLPLESALSLSETCKSMYVLNRLYHPEMKPKQEATLSGSLSLIVKKLFHPSYRQLSHLKLSLGTSIDFSLSDYTSLLQALPSTLTRFDFISPNFTNLKELSTFKTSSVESFHSMQQLTELSMTMNNCAEAMYPLIAKNISLEVLRVELKPDDLNTFCNDVNLVIPPSTLELLKQFKSFVKPSPSPGALSKLECIDLRIDASESPKVGFSRPTSTGKLPSFFALNLSVRSTPSRWGSFGQDTIFTFTTFIQTWPTIREIKFFTMELELIHYFIFYLNDIPSSSPLSLRRLWIHIDQEKEAHTWGKQPSDPSYRSTTSKDPIFQAREQNRKYLRTFTSRSSLIYELIRALFFTLQKHPKLTDLVLGSVPDPSETVSLVTGTGTGKFSYHVRDSSIDKVVEIFEDWLVMKTDEEEEMLLRELKGLMITYPQVNRLVFFHHIFKRNGN